MHINISSLKVDKSLVKINTHAEDWVPQKLNMCFTQPSPSWRPRIRLASCMSLGITVTRLACIAHKLL